MPDPWEVIREAIGNNPDTAKARLRHGDDDWRAQLQDRAFAALASLREQMERQEAARCWNCDAPRVDPDAALSTGEPSE